MRGVIVAGSWRRRGVQGCILVVMVDLPGPELALLGSRGSDEPGEAGEVDMTAGVNFRLRDAE